MTVKELFDFITDPTITEANMNEYLAKSMDIACKRSGGDLMGVEKKEDEIFKHSYIPSNMNEVVDYERDFRRVKQGQSLIYTTLHGIMPDLSKPRLQPEILKAGISENRNKGEENAKVAVVDGEDNKEMEKSENESDEENSDDESEEDDDDESEEDDDDDSEDGSDEDTGETEEKRAKLGIYLRPRDESPNSKKVRKND